MLTFLFFMIIKDFVVDPDQLHNVQHNSEIIKKIK